MAQTSSLHNFRFIKTHITMRQSNPMGKKTAIINLLFGKRPALALVVLHTLYLLLSIGQFPLADSNYNYLEHSRAYQYVPDMAIAGREVEFSHIPLLFLLDFPVVVILFILNYYLLPYLSQATIYYYSWFCALIFFGLFIYSMVVSRKRVRLLPQTT